MTIERALGFSLAAALTLGGCQSTAPGTPAPAMPITARGQEPGWILHLDQSTLSLSYNYGEDQITATAPKPQRIHGQSGCNRYFGRYQLTGEGITTQGLAQTRMACPDALMRQEDRMLKVLRELRRFERPDKGVLVLYGMDNQRLRASRP